MCHRFERPPDKGDPRLCFSGLESRDRRSKKKIPLSKRDFLLASTILCQRTILVYLSGEDFKQNFVNVMHGCASNLLVGN